KFWDEPENKAAKEAEARDADRLSQALEKNGRSLEAAAAQGNSDAAHALLDSYEQLARSSTHADEGITFAGRVNHASPELAKTLADAAPDHDLDKYFEEKVLPSAIPNAQAEIFAAGEEANKAREQLDLLVDGLKDQAVLTQVPKAIDQ